MSREQIRAEKQYRREDDHVEIDTEIPVVETDVDMKEIDRLLDEIDLVLEENPVEFVENYQQRGGE